MKKAIIVRRAVKIGAFLLSFVIVFGLIQTAFSLINTNFSAILGFYELDDHSIDALFLGSSQMYCTIDAPKLTKQYDLSSYDFGTGGQPVPASYYYLQEALKNQKPKIVAIEISGAFSDTFSDSIVALNYSLMPLTVEKYNSLKTLFDDDGWRAALYCIPLVCSHSLWNSVNPVGLMRELISFLKGYEARGFAASDTVGLVDFAFDDDESASGPIGTKTTDSVLKIAKLCEQNDIDLVFFKAPAANWAKSDSNTVKEFMEENHLIYLEMNDYLDEMRIDADTDFTNINHLNKSGAGKATDFIAKYLMETFELS